MNVKRYGTGSRVFLCLHGWNGTHRTFEPLAAELPRDVSLWCPDLPGDCETLDAVTDDIEALARSFDSVHVVGNCSGALHALLLAERMPVERIVMIDAFAYWPLYFRLFLAPGWGRYAYATAFANPVGRWLANQSLARRRTASTNLTAGFAQADHATTYRYLQMLSGVPSPSRFRGIGAPIEICYGERSFAAVRKSVAMWKEIFPQAREHCLAGAGHLPLLETTAPLRNIILENSHAICR